MRILGPFTKCMKKKFLHILVSLCTIKKCRKSLETKLISIPLLIGLIPLICGALLYSQVSIHGIPKTRTWTRLATSAYAGEDQITLQGNDYPNWLPGETVVIAPSGWDPDEAEIKTIVSYDMSTGKFCVVHSLYSDGIP